MTELPRADGLTRHFKIGGSLSRRTLHAVDDVSLRIGEREIVALAGESGRPRRSGCSRWSAWAPACCSGTRTS